MNHSLILKGEAFQLRSVDSGDADFILSLRNDPALNQYVNEGAKTLTEQRQWLEHYFNRVNDWFFIIENKNSLQKEGTIGIYDIKGNRETAEWGRWMIKAGSLSAIESSYLIYQLAFDILGLNEIFCRTLQQNRAVVSFHDSSGLQQRYVLSDYATIKGISYDAVEHVLFQSQWPGVLSDVKKKADRLAGLLNR